MRQQLWLLHNHDLLSSDITWLTDEFVFIYIYFCFFSLVLEYWWACLMLHHHELKQPRSFYGQMHFRAVTHAASNNAIIILGFDFSAACTQVRLFMLSGEKKNISTSTILYGFGAR